MNEQPGCHRPEIGECLCAGAGGVPGKATMCDRLADIVTAASELFIARGPKVPIEDIAGRAGVGVATLYRRFPDRRALLLATLNDRLNRFEEILDLAEKVEDPTAAFDTLFHEGYAAGRSYSPIMGIVLDRQHGGIPDHERLRWKKLSDRATVILTAAQAAGGIRAGITPLELSLILVSVVQPHPGLSDEENERVSRRHAQLVLSGLHERGTALTGEQLHYDDVLPTWTRGGPPPSTAP